MILIGVAILTAIVLSLLGGVCYIDFLNRKVYKQYIRDEAPESHIKKSGTPTTGGVFIVIAAIVASIVTLFMAQKAHASAFLILMTFIFYTFTGFQDDIKKIKNKENKGLSAKGKLCLQIAVALLPALYVTLNGGTELEYMGYSINLGWFYPVFAVFLITGTSNAVNLTDGLDGLAALTLIPAFFACILFSLWGENPALAIIAASVVGALIGFYFFNKHPAKVFMGDTGSLALGGLLGTLAVMGKFEIWMILIGLVFLIETLSVMLQVASFKLTGKRIFKMSPLHHHFELLGWDENKVVTVFMAFSTFFAVTSIGLYIIYKVGL